MKAMRGSRNGPAVLIGALLVLAVVTAAQADNTYPFPKRGNVGIGTVTPPAPLTVVATPNAETIRMIGRANGGIDEASLRLFKSDGSTAHGEVIGSGGSLNLAGGAGGVAVTITGARDVGIGTTSPSARLHVTGNVWVDGNIGAKYQDVAEWVRTRGGLSRGSVVVIDGRDVDHVRPASAPYDARVAGVVSTRPGVLLGEAGPDKVAVAHIGRVKVKADAQYGPIAVGDLLVTSPTPGHAMRSKPACARGVCMHRPGTLLGKALEPLAKGQEEILVLLTLQ